MKRRGRRKLRAQSSQWSRLRVDADVSIRDLEEATGVHRTTLSLLEAGRLVPTPEEADAILSALKRLQAEKVTTLEPSATAEG